MSTYRNNLVWKGDQFFKLFQDDQVKRMTRAAIYLTREIKQAISVAVERKKMAPIGAKDEGSRGRDTRTGRFVKKVKVVLRSKPGEFPRKDFGELRRSITYEIIKNDGQVLARVGTNKIYARYLELGTRLMLKRPFIRPSLDKNRAVLSRIIRGGKP